jgi:hypothetical protein
MKVPRFSQALFVSNGPFSIGRFTSFSYFPFQDTITMETTETTQSDAPAPSTTAVEAPASIKRWNNVSSRFLVTPSPPPATRGEERTTAQLQMIVTNIASAHSLEELKSMKQENKKAFNALDFTDCSIDIIDELFPVIKGLLGVGKKGELPPFSSYRTTSKSLRAWRKLGVKAQDEIWRKSSRSASSLQEPVPTSSSPAVATTVDAGDPPTRRSTRSETARASKRPPPPQDVEDLEDFPLGNPKRSSSSPLPGDGTAFLPILKEDLEAKFDRQSSPLVSRPVSVYPFSSCEGIAAKLYTADDSQSQEKDKIQTGFSHLTGEAMHNLSSTISQGWSCPLNVGEYCGFLDAKITGPKTSPITYFLRLLSDYAEIEPVPPRENSLEQRYAFHASSCTGKKERTSSGMCKECFSKKNEFARMCKSEVDHRGNPTANQKHGKLLCCDLLACAVTL